MTELLDICNYESACPNVSSKANSHKKRRKNQRQNILTMQRNRHPGSFNINCVPNTQ